MVRIAHGVIAAVLLALPASAAADAYLRLDGVGGTASGGTIALSSLAYASGRPIDAAAPGVGPARTDLHAMRAVKPVDAASAALWQAAASGEHFPTAFVYVRQAAGGAYRGYRLKDVVLSGFDTSGHAGPATERFTLNFVDATPATAHDSPAAPQRR